MITAQVNQSLLRGGQRVPMARINEALKVCSRSLGSPDLEVSIAFIAEKEIRRLNKTWRGKDTVTDVLSFEDPAEVLLSYEQAARQAVQMGHSTRDEIIFLLVHGVLHVMGHDHERPVDAKKMFSLQEKILTRLGIDARL